MSEVSRSGPSAAADDAGRTMAAASSALSLGGLFFVALARFALSNSDPMFVSAMILAESTLLFAVAALGASVLAAFRARRQPFPGAPSAPRFSWAITILAAVGAQVLAASS